MEVYRNFYYMYIKKKYELYIIYIITDFFLLVLEGHSTFDNDQLFIDSAGILTIESGQAPRIYSHSQQSCCASSNRGSHLWTISASDAN